MVGVSRMHDVITVAVKHDGRDKRLLVLKNVRSFSGRGRVWRMALPHGGECGNQIVGGPAGQTRMHGDGGIEIRVGRPHHGGRSRSG